MGIRIKFDPAGNTESPTLVLASKGGRKLGSLPACNINFKDSLNSYSEISFSVNRYDNGSEIRLWKEIKDFKLVYAKEWDIWFEIQVELSDGNTAVKNVTGKSLSEAELSQVMLYNIEINTEDDIARDDYEAPTVLWNNEYPNRSLLSRLMEKVPHYTVEHVDATIANIQKTFSFNGISIYDAFMEIAEEIGCLFFFDSGTDSNGNICRKIYVFDLEANCLDEECKHRGEFTDVCPECKGTNIKQGYGKDTHVFVSSEDLAEEISYYTDVDSVKNCFKVEGGDDLITATVRNCNPNGTDYIWHITEDMKSDMSSDLKKKLESYDSKYSSWQDEEVISISEEHIKRYNSLIEKYSAFKEDLPKFPEEIKGFPALMNVYYDTIDLEIFLRSGLMPTVDISDFTAETEAAKLTSDALSPVAVINLEAISQASADNAVLAMAKVVVHPNFKVEIKESSLSGNVWKGSFTVTSYAYDEELHEKDTDYICDSGEISVEITDNVTEFALQKIEKALNNQATDDLSIVGLFEKELSEFETELKKYSLNFLTLFYNCCDGALNILIEQGISSEDKTKDEKTPADLYSDYYEKLKAIQAEMKIREDDILSITGLYNEDGERSTVGIQNLITDKRDEIQKELDFEAYLGEKLWREFCAYRREDKYSNSNYISDGLNNAELFGKALELLEVATEEIYKSSELQHSISTTLKNLLVMKEFEPLTEHFEVGNFIRIKVCDDVYKLRLISYEIDFENLNTINVEFSDVLKVANGISDVQSILEQAASIASSYSAVMHQASQGSSGSKRLDTWVEDGISLTNMKIVSSADNQEIKWDNNGFVMREYFPVTKTFSDKQLKIINKGLYITDDGWETFRAGIGNFRYKDPSDDMKEKEAYGVIADTIVGNIILGESVGIYNEANNITLNKDGFNISNTNNKDATYTVNIAMNPNNIENVFYIDSTKRETEDGNAVITKLLNVNAEDGTLSIGGGNFKVDSTGKLSIGADNFVVDADGTAHINNIIMGGNITWESEPWGDIDVDLDGYMHEDDYSYLTTTKITSTTIESPTIEGGTITGGRIIGGSYWNSDEDSYLVIGYENGSLSDLALYGYNYNSGSSRAIFGIEDHLSETVLTALGDSSDGYSILKTTGKETYPLNTWDFQYANIKGIKITFG